MPKWVEVPVIFLNKYHNVKEPLVSIESVNLFHLFLWEFPSQELLILLHMQRVWGFRNHWYSLLNSPSQYNLSYCFPLSFTHLSKVLIIDYFVLLLGKIHFNIRTSRQCGIWCQVDMFLIAEPRHYLASHVRMELILKHSRLYFSCIPKITQQGNVKVWNSNSLAKSIFNQLLHSFPGYCHRSLILHNLFGSFIQPNLRILDLWRLIFDWDWIVHQVKVNIL